MTPALSPELRDRARTVGVHWERVALATPDTALGRVARETAEVLALLAGRSLPPPLPERRSGGRCTAALSVDVRPGRPAGSPCGERAVNGTDRCWTHRSRPGYEPEDAR